MGPSRVDTARLLFDGEPGRSITDAGGYAKTLEDMGFTSVWIADHVVTFEHYEPNYPGSPDGLPPFGPRQGWFDPLICLAAMATTTSRIRLQTNILILPQRNPVLLAKEVAALDHLSGGRIDFGVGIGWSPEEFAALGVPWERRGARTDDYIRAITCLWQDDLATYEGEFVSFKNVVALPKPLQQPRPPLIVGGQSKSALRRAAHLGDGWSSLLLGAEDISITLRELDAQCEAAGRDPSTLRRSHTIYYTGPSKFKQAVERAQAHGVHHLDVMPRVPGRDPFDVIAEIAKINGQ